MMIQSLAQQHTKRASIQHCHKINETQLEKTTESKKEILKNQLDLLNHEYS